MYVFCWQRQDVLGCEVSDLIDVVPDVVIVNRWVAGRLFLDPLTAMDRET